MAPRSDAPRASLRTSAAAGVAGMKGPSPPSAIRHQTRLGAPACNSMRRPPRSVPRKRRRSAMRVRSGAAGARSAPTGRAPATTATTARHGGSTVPSRRRRRCRECRSVERTAPAPAGRRRRPSACPVPAASCDAGSPHTCRPGWSAIGLPAPPRIVATRAGPRGASLPGMMPKATRSTGPVFSASSTTAPVMAGAVLAPEQTSTFAFSAASARRSMPRTKAESSARST